MTKFKRITIEVPEEWHAKIKARVALQNMSIKTWVLKAIIQLTREEDKQ